MTENSQLFARQAYFALCTEAVAGQIATASTDSGESSFWQPLLVERTAVRESIECAVERLLAVPPRCSIGGALASDESADSESANGFLNESPSQDLFRELYHSLVPRSVRHRLGEYYTPAWLVDHVLDQVGYCPRPARAIRLGCSIQLVDRARS